MRCLLVIGILIAVILQPLCAVTNDAQQSKPVPSTWAMQFPPGWVPMKSNFAQCLMLMYDSKHADHLASINVIYNVAGNMTLNDVFKSVEKTAPKLMKNYKLLEQKDAKVGGLSAYSVIFTTTDDELGTMEYKSYVVIRKGISYTFTLGCLKKHFQEHSKVFDSIIASIKWVEPPADGQNGL